MDNESFKHINPLVPDAIPEIPQHLTDAVATLSYTYMNLTMDTKQVFIGQRYMQRMF